MKKLWKIALGAFAPMLLSACSSTPSVIAIPEPIRVIPVQCLVYCQPMPEPTGPSEGEMSRWERRMVTWGEMRATRHNECVTELGED